MTELPDLSQLTHEEKDALIRALWAQVQAVTAQVQTLVAWIAVVHGAGRAKMGGGRPRLQQPCLSRAHLEPRRTACDPA